ncbi:MAG: cobyric acid synthase [Lachnospirales bacterium]
MTKQLMIQGTSSGVGKSIITTGLCRMLKQDNLKVATFKSQNMTNNVYALADGSEIAKTQWIASLACRAEPIVEMNPVVLRILNKGTDIILKGKSQGVMTREEYEEYKKNVWKDVMGSYEFLCKNYEAIIIEGAGSPVELNLLENDIVNMNLAKKINSPVFLVVDIDRGGAFAYVKGTLDLLEKDELKLVKGIIINKCKGNIVLFKEVVEKMEEITGIKVVGTIPYKPIDIEDEDNLIDPEFGVKTEKSVEYMHKQFDILADHLRANLDMEYVYKILKEGVQYER